MFSIVSYAKFVLWYRPFWNSNRQEIKWQFVKDHSVIMHVQFRCNQISSFWENNNCLYQFSKYRVLCWNYVIRWRPPWISNWQDGKILNDWITHFYQWGSRGRDHMVVGFTTIYAISAYHHWCWEFESRSGRGVQHYVIKFVNDLPQVGGFLRVLPFPPPIKLTATI